VRYIANFVRNFFKKADLLLLLLCLVTTAFGCLVIASTSNVSNSGFTRYVIVQVVATIIGVGCYAVFSSIDTDFFSEHRRALIFFCFTLILMLIPFGTDNGSGNKSWIPIPVIGIYMQPAEVCKIPLVLILASIMASHQNRPSHVFSVLHLGFVAGALVIANVVISKDLGVSLIFVFIFLVMAFTGGISLFWFFGGLGATAVAAPVLWSMLDNYQRYRIQVLFDPSLDPNGLSVRYHTVRSLRSLTGGGLLGQGLFNGNRTQTPDALFAQHTDFIFSAIGEELGYIGCLLVLVLLFLIIARIIWVGTRSQDYLRRMVCFGCAAALIFQVTINVGMCMGLLPVIGLTLPFISYGGSSIISLYAMMGLVSGVYAKPAPTSQERYIRPYRL
jgi:rod shape determining protein RodA